MLRQSLLDRMNKSAKSKILIIDDSEINTLLLVSLLEQEHELLTATDGQSGIDMAIAESPDLILLDVTMPGMDGYTVCDELKTNAQTKDVPIVFVTAMDELEDEARGLELGAIDYITKPYSPQIVKARIRNHLELKLARDRLMQLSMIDGLTSIPNRRQFDKAINREWQRGIRRQEAISILLMDIDFFKQYNDLYGHLKGDDCLKQVANVISSQMQRTTDLAARYGGEEFVCILPETDIDGATHIAHRIINQLEQLRIEHKGSKVCSYVTLSIGICSRVPDTELNVVDFVGLADKALYSAKQQGRNRYVIAPD